MQIGEKGMLEAAERYRPENDTNSMRTRLKAEYDNVAKRGEVWIGGALVQKD